MLAALLFFIALTLPSTYLFGLVPAGLTGLVWRGLGNRSAAVRLAVSVVVGAAASAALMGSLAGEPVEYARWAAIGAAAALVCGGLVLVKRRAG